VHFRSDILFAGLVPNLYNAYRCGLHMDWAPLRKRPSAVASTVSSSSAEVRPRPPMTPTMSRAMIAAGALLCTAGLILLLSSTSGDMSTPLQSVARLGVDGESSNAERPPDKRALGRATWTAFHAMAANFPEKPSPAQQADGLAFVRSISKLYPCPLCREHFDRYVAVKPPE
jgi:hypothetical protein